jgi:hypothetical protein
MSRATLAKTLSPTLSRLSVGCWIDQPRQRRVVERVDRRDEGRVSSSSLSSFATTFSVVIPWLSAIVVLSRRSVEQTDDHGARGGRNYVGDEVPSDPVPHQLWDVTVCSITRAERSASVVRQPQG